ncbi:MAG: peptidoglycan-binding protein LysM, partial [Longimicrobiaceae bacterium]
DPLPFPEAIRLPTLSLVAGTSAHATSFADVAGYYGEGLTALAAHNAAVPGIFAGRSVVIPGGPTVRTATVAAGVQAVAAARPAPAPVPLDPTVPGFANLFLLNGFSLLSQQVYGNVDFTASDPGLPAGPTTDPADADNAGKVRAPRAAAEVDEWDYSQALPYYRFAKSAAPASPGTLPPQSENPYPGVGGLLQVTFGWLDYFGNTLVTTLSDPPGGAPRPYNDPPLLTGYTDALVALSQWPSVASSWQVQPASGGGKPQLVLGLGFDPSRYQGVLQAQAAGATTVVVLFTNPLDPASATDPARYRLVPEVAVQSAALSGDGLTVTLTVAGLANGIPYTVVASDVAGTAQGSSYSGQATFDYPDDPQARTSTVQRNAQQDLHVYTQLYYQLTDPNGVAYALETTLLGDADHVSGSVPLPQADVDALFAWLFGPAGTPSIFAFVQDRSQFGVTAPAPAASLPLAVEVDPAKVNPAQVFELWLSLALERTGGAVLGDLETTPGIRRTATRVPPLQDAVGSGASGTLGLTTFAEGYEAGLSQAGAYLLKVATGVDRTRATPAGGGGGTVWSVRLGVTLDEPIAYQVTDAGDPAVFAPRPVSNQLQSRTAVPIYDYATGTGISPTPSRYVDFSEVDLDTWCQQTFAAVDGVLTPQFTAPIQIVDHFTGSAWLQAILDGKKALADLAKRWMIPVFADETADPAEAQEAFYQQLLVRLAAAYTTRAALEFQAKVTAQAVADPNDPAPRLFGNVSRTGPVFEAAFVEEAVLGTVFLRFSDPMDRASAENPANYTLSDQVQALTATLDVDVVTLTTSKDVVPGTTTATVANLVDVLGRPVRAPLVQTVTTGSVEEPASTLVFSSPKLALATGTGVPLTFLLSAPETVRGAGGEVVSYVELGLQYDASQIEHQIGSVPGIEGYVASSWLAFVTSPDEELTADLGSFAVPMVLRAFPASPAMTEQAGPPTYGLEATDLSQLTRWSYSFTYSLPFHYPQDRVYGEVEFNLQQSFMALAGFEDAFNQLAEFVNVFPEVDRDFQSLLASIDATTDPVADKEKVDDASVALQSFVQLVDELVAAAGGGSAQVEGVEPMGLVFRAPPRTLMGTPDLTFTFYIEEGEVDFGDTRDALLVRLVGAVPAGIDPPQVLVSPDLYEVESYPATQGPCAEPDTLCFVYRIKAGPGPSGSYLTAADGQTITDRTVVLPDMDILQRQDAWSTVYLTRNQILVPGRPSAEPFVYTTPEVRFSSPLFPTNDSLAEVNVATVGGAGSSPPPVTRPLPGQLENLFAVLLAHNTQPELTIQVEFSYDYPLNPSLSSVPLPVLMQAPLAVQVAGTGAGTLQEMLATWSTSVEAWFANYTPTCGGTLWIDLTIMSDLTQQPMPLLRLRSLYLPLQYVQPSLPCRANG